MAGDSRIAEETLSRVLPVPVPTRSTASWNSGKSIEELDPKPIKKRAHAQKVIASEWIQKGAMDGEPSKCRQEKTLSMDMLATLLKTFFPAKVAMSIPQNLTRTA